MAMALGGYAVTSGEFLGPEDMGEGTRVWDLGTEDFG